MAHNFLALDFETYYADDYTLKQLTPPEYILDPRFETIMCAVKVNGGKSFIVDGPDFPQFLAQYDPHDTTTVTFNALFDNCILAWVYGFVPARMYCAMRMATALRGHLLASASLAGVCRLLHLPPKGTEIENVKGMRRAAILASGRWQAFSQYALGDVDRCQEIFNLLIPEFPYAERRVMDRVLRCAVEPRFMIDTDLLRAHLEDLRESKRESLIAASGGQIDPADPHVEELCAEFASSLRSNTKFEEVLTNLGVDVEYKQSITDPERKIPAFAKTDEFMSDLQVHDDPVVQALAVARLGLRSTIEESRGARILRIAELPWQHYRDGNPRLYSGGTMPIPLRYSGAHTHRLSGDWLINMQNMPSSRQKKSKLRKSLVAPPGHKVVVADLAQIECRINAWLCGEQGLLDVFRAKGDPYAQLAQIIFSILKVDKNIHKIERFIGKSGELGLGFGCGHDKFYNMVIRSARVLGMDVNKLREVWTPQLAETSVLTYRQLRRGIVASWRRLDSILGTSWIGTTLPVMWGPVEIGAGYVKGPGDLKMMYDVKCRTPGEFTYAYGKRHYRMYGPKFLENIVQFLARIVIMNAALRIGDRTKKNFALQAHDELAWIVPDAETESFMVLVREELVRPPSWAPTIPLDCEVGSGQSYGDAK